LDSVRWGCRGCSPEVILTGMTSRVGPKGQVVIPKSMRDRLGIAPGDEVDFSLDGAGVRVEPVREQTGLRGSLAGRGLVSELEADHRAERDQ
jgi:AbrB family looped-hinge helix DNA binding protein